MILKRFLSHHFYLGLGCLIFLIATSENVAGQQIVRGKVIQQQNEGGTFQVYLPKKVVSDVEVLVICHGTIEKENAVKTSRKFIDRWLKLSELTGVVLVAPAFDKRNYASGKNVPGGAAWGYRSLDGRTTKPDEFVHSILKQLKKLAPSYDEKFYLYGHSAGAQFANHYLMVHPDRLKGVILSAPAIYAMPDFDTVWPNGLKQRERVLDWGDGPHPFKISHEKKKIVKAVQVPIAVVIGAKDTKHMSDKPQRAGQRVLLEHGTT